MQIIDDEESKAFISSLIDKFSHDMIETVNAENYDKLVKKVLRKKNPYLMKAKGILLASELANRCLEAFLSSKEETIFGMIFDQICVWILKQQGGKGTGDTITGIDAERTIDNIHQLVQQKSGPHWGNDSQKRQLKEDCAKVITAYPDAQCYNTCAYGREKRSNKGTYIKLCGQEAWEFLTGDKDYYTKLLGCINPSQIAKAKFDEQRKVACSKFVETMKTLKFCDENEVVDWDAIMKFNSGNLPKAKKPKKSKKVAVGETQG